MAEGEEVAAVVGSAFVVLDVSEFIEEQLHEFIGALLWYILDKHFLPHLLFGTHCMKDRVLGTPRGLTVMLPPWVIMGVMVKGSNTR